MTIGWFIIWWTMLAIGMLIYDIQFRIKKTDILIWESIKFACYFPVVLIALILRTVFGIEG